MAPPTQYAIYNTATHIATSTAFPHWRKKRRKEERERGREQICATNHTLHSTKKITTRLNSDVHIFYTPYRDFTGACCSNQAFDVTYLAQPLIFAINSNTTDQLKRATSSYQKRATRSSQSLPSMKQRETKKREDFQHTGDTSMRKFRVHERPFQRANDMIMQTKYPHLQAFNGRRAFNGAFPFNEIPPCRGEGA